MYHPTIYVIGHKNPDTDSICSAMAYARLRTAQGLSGVQAARAGNVNRQTEFVLAELALPHPPLLTDVHPRVRDLITGPAVTVPPEAPLSRALELFHLHGVRLLPVVDGERRPLGVLFLQKVSERFLVPRQESEIRRVQASVASVARCLQAQLLHGVETEPVEDLRLFVGAMDSATFHQRMAAEDPRRMILVTGDRLKIMREAVELGVRLLVVTGSLPVPEEILQRGREQGVSILSTPFDTATTSWLTRLSTPASSLIGGDFPTIGELERVEDLRLKLLHSGDAGVVVLDADGRVSGVATKSSLLQPAPVKLILVDHNELSQAVPGADKVEILEVIDHHRLGNLQTEQPIRFVNQPLGSTCSVVATLFRDAGITPDRVTAGLMLAGLLSDTVILKSPTTTDLDRQLSNWLGGIAGLDPIDFGRRIFSAGSSLAAYASPEEIVLTDFKEFGSGEGVFGVGQVEVVSFAEFQGLKAQLATTLGRLRQEKKLVMAALLVTDIVRETSLLLALGNKELPYIIGYPQLEENLYELKGVLSRKKQLVPHLLKVLSG